MQGVVLRSDGSPWQGLKVETVESSVRTDARGGFGLYYKRPDTHVHFTVDDTWYRRKYLPSDRGTEVEIRAPEVHDLTILCGDFACDLQLQWKLSPGFSAKSRSKCASGETRTLHSVPTSSPQVECRAGITGPKQEIMPSFVGHSLRLSPITRALKVELLAEGEPVHCEVGVGATWLEVTSREPVELPVVGDGLVSGRCDGRPAIPVRFDEQTTEVSIPWASIGPSLQPAPGLELARLRLVRQGPNGWTLHVNATPEGEFLLPPLSAGLYQLQLYNGEPTEVPILNSEGLTPREVRGQLLASGHYAGALRLETSLGEGVLEAGGLDD